MISAFVAGVMFCQTVDDLIAGKFVPAAISFALCAVNAWFARRQRKAYAAGAA